MKLLLTSLLLGLCVSAMAQQSRTSMTRTSIDDDDKTLYIEVEATVDGKEINYTRRFKVAGMSEAEKDALKKRVFDSLGIAEVPKPPMKPPMPSESYEALLDSKVPVAQSSESEQLMVKLTCESCMGKGKLMISGDGYSFERESRTEGEKRMFPMEVELRPGEYRYMYWQEGVLQMQLPFTVKAGQKNVVPVKWKPN